jgi:hypothetical protein
MSLKEKVNRLGLEIEGVSALEFSEIGRFFRNTRLVNVGTDASIEFDSEEEDGIELRFGVDRVGNELSPEFEAFLRRLKELQAEHGFISSPGASCGIHVHVSPASKRVDKKIGLRAMIAFAIFQGSVIGLGLGPARNRRNYSRSFVFRRVLNLFRVIFTKRDIERREELMLDLFSAFAFLTNSTHGNRYAAFNPQSIQEHGTIEYRLFDGTTVPEDIRRAVRISVNLFRMSSVPWDTLLLCADYLFPSNETSSALVREFAESLYSPIEINRVLLAACNVAGRRLEHAAEQGLVSCEEIPLPELSVDSDLTALAGRAKIWRVTEGRRANSPTDSYESA